MKNCGDCQWIWSDFCTERTNWTHTRKAIHFLSSVLVFNA